MIFGNDRTNNNNTTFEQHDFSHKLGSLARIWESSDEDDNERKEDVSSESSLDEDPLHPFLPQL